LDEVFAGIHQGESGEGFSLVMERTLLKF
jgi:hypothetical protein